MGTHFGPASAIAFTATEKDNLRESKDINALIIGMPTRSEIADAESES